MKLFAKILIGFIFASAFCIGLWGVCIFAIAIAGASVLASVAFCYSIKKLIYLILGKIDFKRMFTNEALKYKVNSIWWGLLGIAVTVIVIGAVWLAGHCSTTTAEPWGCWLNGFSSLLINIAGGLVGLFCIYILLRPHFKLDPVLAVSPNNRLLVKVSNSFLLTKLYNIKVEMFYYAYNEDVDDEVQLPINMDTDSTLSILYGRYKGKAQSSYVFHTKDGFIRDYSGFEGVLCRVTATHAISNITSSRDYKFPFENKYVIDRGIVYGSFVGTEFVPEVINKSNQMIQKYNKIHDVSKIILKASIEYTDTKLLEARESVKEALSAVLDLDNMQSDYSRLSEITGTRMSMINDLRELSALYNSELHITPELRDKRKPIIERINRNMVFVARQMQYSIEK